MLGTRLASVNRVSGVGWAIAFLLTLTSCTRMNSQVQPRAIKLHQTWQLQPGSVVAGHHVAGGLGDISIDLQGDSVYAPFDGRVQPHQQNCVVFSSSELPAYLLRLCGLKRPKLGDVDQGRAIGSAETLQFAALRRQPDGSWTMVEPSTSLLERTLKQP